MAGPVWSREALGKLGKVPVLLRKTVKGLVESHAEKRSVDEISAAFLDEARKEFFRSLAGASREGDDKGPREGEKLSVVDCCKGGSLGCPYAVSDTAPLGKALEDALSRSPYIGELESRIDGLLLPHHRVQASVSACPNSCSQPQIRDFGVQALSFPKCTSERCAQCRLCVDACREEAVVLAEDGPVIDTERCLGCGGCHRVCPSGTLARGDEGLRVLLGGKLGRHPRLAVALPRLFAPEEVPAVLEAVLEAMRAHGHWGRRLGELMESQPGLFRTLLERLERP